MEAKDRKVDVRMALRAYQNITRLGERDGEGYKYDGLTASTDFDGYTVVISDGAVTLRIFFHHRFSIEPDKGKAIDQFLARLARVAKAE